MSTLKPATRFVATALGILAGLAFANAAAAEPPESRPVRVTVASEISVDVRTAADTAVVALKPAAASFTFLAAGPGTPSGQPLSVASMRSAKKAALPASSPWLASGKTGAPSVEIALAR